MTRENPLKSAYIFKQTLSILFIEHSSKNVNQFHFFLTDTNINPWDVKT